MTGEGTYDVVKWRSHRATGVSFRPPQKAWKVSKVTKSFHFLSSKGIAQTFLRKSSYLSVIFGRKETEKLSVKHETKVIKDKKPKTHQTP